MICYFCGKEVSDADRFMLGNDRPYFNLYMHKSCFEDSKEHINIKKLFEFYEKSQKEAKKREKTPKVAKLNIKE